ncbi:MAG: hypoxanthine phosphoribosyltransferase [Elusimicrobia bacterium]|nr:hypoxanthine phosphoribosyltransferase [Elusimicrobiota bacterium]
MSSPHPDIEKILIPTDQIGARVGALGREISKDYQGKVVTLIGVLKGSIVFLSDLLRAITVDCSIDLMCLSSYEGDRSSGVVRMVLDLRESIEGKDVLVVEDIVDTGLTLAYLRDNLKTRKPRSLEICTLLDKTECRQIPLQAKYVGFKVPNQFLVGYGLDYNEQYRNLPYVGVLKEERLNGPRV